MSAPVASKSVEVLARMRLKNRLNKQTLIRKSGIQPKEPYLV